MTDSCCLVDIVVNSPIYTTMTSRHVLCFTLMKVAVRLLQFQIRAEEVRERYGGLKIEEVQAA